MLRLLVLLLILANAAYFAWSQGMLAELGLAPRQQSEPQRLQQQINPESLRLMPSPAPPASSSLQSNFVPVVAQTAAECLQSGFISEGQVELLRTSLLGNLPADSWQLESSVEPARWLVYMGKYREPDMLSKKRVELRERGVLFEEVRSAALAPGLSLGSFESEVQAQQALNRITSKGVRSARVVLEKAEKRGHILRVPVANSALKAQLEELTPALDGKALRVCSS